MTPILSLHNIDVTAFLAVLDTCEGNVYLVTKEGDRLNLRSKLCQLVGLTKLIEGGKIASTVSYSNILNLLPSFVVCLVVVVVRFCSSDSIYLFNDSLNCLCKISSNK